MLTANRSSRWLPLLLWAALIFIVSMDHNPYRALPTVLRQPFQVVGKPVGEVELFGKPGHVLEYAILGLLAARALLWRRKSTAGLFALTFAVCEAYALSDEVHQIFVPGRAFDLPDLLIDGAGILTGLALYWLLRRYRSRQRKVVTI